MEHNQNVFARSGSSGADPTTPTIPATPGNRLDFDPIELRTRGDGWTRDRQRAFIDELADCGVVREAAARVGMSEQSAYRLRRRDDAASFNIAWEAALQLGADHLRSVAYERAVHGVIRPHFYHGEKVGEERVFNDRLLLALLARADRTVFHFDASRAIANWERWMEAIEDGAPPPPGRLAEEEEPRVWQDDGGHWWTDFRPPPDPSTDSAFAGDCRGEYGDEDYCRRCTADELASIEATEAREEADKHRRRDAFFTRMKTPIPSG